MKTCRLFSNTCQIGSTPPIVYGSGPIPSRIGILADIHANVWALEAVLADAHRQGVTALLNLGDILYGPLQPLETYQRLSRESFLIVISGNQDRQIVDATRQERANNPTLDYVVRDLGPEPVEWLKSLPAVAALQHELLLCHGTPRSDETYLLEDVTGGRACLRQEFEILQELGTIPHPLILCGHSHYPRLVRLSNGQIIVNPGSVGLPAYHDDTPVPHKMENHAPHACYAILTREDAGWSVAFHKIAYDWDQASQCADSLGRADWAQGIATGHL